MKAVLGVAVATVLVSVGCGRGLPGRVINDYYRVRLDLSAQEYRLRAEDRISIEFQGAEQYNQENVIIREDGGISTTIGEFRVAGLTISAAEELIRRSQEVLADPIVSVRVVESAPTFVWVTGEVTNPGPVTYRRSMTALEALMEAGGNLPSGKTWKALIVRHTSEGEAAVHRVDIRDFENPLIMLPRDVLYVPRTNIANVGVFVDQYIRRLLPIPIPWWTF